MASDSTSVEKFLKKCGEDVVAIGHLTQIVNQLSAKLEYYLGIKYLIIDHFEIISPRYHPYTFMIAAYHGKLDVIEYGIHNFGEILKHEFDDDIDDVRDLFTYIAIISGNIDVLIYLDSIGFLSPQTDEIYALVFATNNADVVDYFVNQITDATVNMINSCILTGNVEVLLRLLDKGGKLKPSEHTLTLAIQSANLQMVKLIFEVGLAEDKHVKPYMIVTCARICGISIAKYLIEERNLDFTKRSADAIMFAIEYGHLEYLRFLSSLGIDVVIPKNQKPLELAVKMANIPICNYLISKGASMKYSAKHILWRASRISVEMVEYVLALGPTYEQVYETMRWNTSDRCIPEIIILISAYCVDLVLTSGNKKKLNNLIILFAKFKLSKPTKAAINACTDLQTLASAILKAIMHNNADVAEFIFASKGPDVLIHQQEIITAALTGENLQMVRLVFETFGCNLELDDCMDSFNMIIDGNVDISVYLLEKIEELSVDLAREICAHVIANRPALGIGCNPNRVNLIKILKAKLKD
jgi:hypothetical protein